MSKYNDRFLADLGQLLKHGKEPLSQLIADLNDPIERERIIDTLKELMRVAPERPARVRRSSGKAHSETLFSVPVDELADPARYGLLKDLYQWLQQTETFKDRRLLLRLSSELQVRALSKDSRTKIMQAIITNLAALPFDELRQVTENIHSLERGSSESFKELARFITGGGRS